MGIKGKIHSFETFGAVDGPGIRFVVFLSGCNFRCAYCHNPDTWARPPVFEMTAAEVFARALRYRAYWGSEGGITLSGGEPMLQSAFAAELFELARSEGVNTCLDTAGGPFRADDAAQAKLLDLTDLVLLDLKAMSPDLHRWLVEADNAPVLALARHLSERGKPMWIRHVMVKGLTDTRQELTALKKFTDSLVNVVKTEFLPYHEMGVPKWKALGLEYRL